MNCLIIVHVCTKIQVITLFNTEAGEKVEQYYDNYVKSSNVMAVFNLSGEHTFVRFTLYTLCLKNGHAYYAS